METDFCIDALQEAIVKYGCPEVFNTDQGSQFTSEAQKLVDAAHIVCPYSNATRGNINVTLNAIT